MKFITVIAVEGISTIDGQRWGIQCYVTDDKFDYFIAETMQTTFPVDVPVESLIWYTYEMPVEEDE